MRGPFFSFLVVPGYVRMQLSFDGMGPDLLAFCLVTLARSWSEDDEQAQVAVRNHSAAR